MGDQGRGLSRKGQIWQLYGAETGGERRKTGNQMQLSKVGTQLAHPRGSGGGVGSGGIPDTSERCNQQELLMD